MIQTPGPTTHEGLEPFLGQDEPQAADSSCTSCHEYCFDLPHTQPELKAQPLPLGPPSIS